MIQECGIGRESSDESPGRSVSPDLGQGEAGAGHRVLVFAQLKGMLDLVEADVLRPAGVSFLRLDGRPVTLNILSQTSLKHAETDLDNMICLASNSFITLGCLNQTT